MSEQYIDTNEDNFIVYGYEILILIKIVIFFPLSSEPKMPALNSFLDREANFISYKWICQLPLNAALQVEKKVCAKTSAWSIIESIISKYKNYKCEMYVYSSKFLWYILIHIIIFLINHEKQSMQLTVVNKCH